MGWCRSKQGAARAFLGAVLPLDIADEKKCLHDDKGIFSFVVPQKKS